MWRHDLHLSYMPPELREYLFENKIYHEMRARVFVAEKNKLASDALWDGRFISAFALMKKHGFIDKINHNLPGKYQDLRYKAKMLGAGLLAENRAKSSRSSWGTVKASKK